MTCNSHVPCATHIAVLMDVLTAYGGQQSGEADLNPKILGWFFFSPHPKRKMLLLAIRKTNTWIGELLLKMGKKSRGCCFSVC